jgi:hypothetical protein
MILMRVCAVTLALALAPAASADMAPVPPPPGVLPDDPGRMAFIRQRHASIVRRAERRCAHQYGWNGGVNFRACVVTSVDTAVMASENPQLIAYHRSLPFGARYQWRDPGPTPWQMR